jgi:hypothetical protein
MAFEELQQLLRLLVEKIPVQDGPVKVETVIPTGDHHNVLRLPHMLPVRP